MRFGTLEILLIVFFILILFGARRIPDLMRSLGIGIKEFKSGLQDSEPEVKEEKPPDDKDWEDKVD